MEIKIYKTTVCGACKTLLGLIPKGTAYELINLDKIPPSEHPVLKGAPTVYVDGKILDNAFAVLDMISKADARSIKIRGI